MPHEPKKPDAKRLRDFSMDGGFVVVRQSPVEIEEQMIRSRPGALVFQ